MRLGFVSATYPFAAKEPYLDVELRALAPSLDALVVYPAAPQSRERGFAAVPGEVVSLPLFAPRTLLPALRAALAHPRRVLGVLRALLFDRYPVRVKLKNLAVLPKGLALAEVARAHRLEHLHAYWLSTPATVAWIAGRVAGIPFSATAHRWDVYENNMAARKLREAAFVRTISARGRADLLSRADAGGGANVHVVRLGVELANDVPHDSRAAASAPNAANATPPNASNAVLRILCAAALVPVKGHRTLLEALRILRDEGVAFECTLAGEGPLRAEIAAAIARLGLDDAVHLVGRIPHDELLAALASGRYDVSVIASVERPGGLMEGVPVALVEAMGAGCAVVATDSGSIGELVDGETGLLVPHSDPGALARALAGVARDPTLAERIRTAGRARVRFDYDVRRTIPQLRALLAGRETRERVGIASETSLAAQALAADVAEDHG